MHSTYQNDFNQQGIVAYPRIVARISMTTKHETYNEIEALQRMENEGGSAPPKAHGAIVGALCDSSDFFGNMVLRRWHDLPSITVDDLLFKTC